MMKTLSVLFVGLLQCTAFAADFPSYSKVFELQQKCDAGSFKRLPWDLKSPGLGVLSTASATLLSKVEVSALLQSKARETSFKVQGVRLGLLDCDQGFLPTVPSIQASETATFLEPRSGVRRRVYALVFESSERPGLALAGEGHLNCVLTAESLRAEFPTGLIQQLCRGKSAQKKQALEAALRKLQEELRRTP